MVQLSRFPSKRHAGARMRESEREGQLRNNSRGFDRLHVPTTSLTLSNAIRMSMRDSACYMSESEAVELQWLGLRFQQ